MNEVNKNTIVGEIEGEYRRINNKWLALHYYTVIGIAAFGVVFECIFGSIRYASGLIDGGFLAYLLKFVMSPLLMNVFLTGIGVWTMRNDHVDQKIRVYIMSFLFAGVCFVIYMTYNIYGSLYMMFVGPVLFTIVYSDYILTASTSLLCVAAKALSDLVINWDGSKTNILDTYFGTTDFVISICIMCIFSVLCFVVISFEKKKNIASIQKEIERYHMRQKLITDELTNVYNRTALRYAFDNMERDDVNASGYVFAMIDIDNFKELNDQMGHDKGDQCLKDFGSILKNYCRDNALPVRFGGDEFCILFENTTLEKVVEACRNIQSDFSRSAISNKAITPITISVGIAPYSRFLTARQLLKNSDTALYRAKALKNFICVYEDIDEAIAQAE